MRRSLRIGPWYAVLLVAGLAACGGGGGGGSAAPTLQPFTATPTPAPVPSNGGFGARDRSDHVFDGGERQLRVDDARRIDGGRFYRAVGLAARQPSPPASSIAQFQISASESAGLSASSLARRNERHPASKPRERASNRQPLQEGSLRTAAGSDRRRTHHRNPAPPAAITPRGNLSVRAAKANLGDQHVVQSALPANRRPCHHLPESGRELHLLRQRHRHARGRRTARVCLG